MVCPCIMYLLQIINGPDSRLLIVQLYRLLASLYLEPIKLIIFCAFKFIINDCFSIAKFLSFVSFSRLSIHNLSSSKVRKSRTHNCHSSHSNHLKYTNHKTNISLYFFSYLLHSITFYMLHKETHIICDSFKNQFSYNFAESSNSFFILSVHQDDLFRINFNLF